MLSLVDSGNANPANSFLRLIRGDASETEQILSDFFAHANPCIRYLALIGYIRRRETEKIVSALQDASILVRGLAIRACPKSAIEDARLVKIILNQPQAFRMGLIRGLCRSKRQAAANVLLPKLMERQLFREAKHLLGHCSAVHIEPLVARLSIDKIPWNQLAIRHPDICCRTIKNVLEKQAKAHKSPPWSEIQRALLLLTRTHPEAVFKMLRPHLSPYTLPRWALMICCRLMNTCETEVTDWICTPQRTRWRKDCHLPTCFIRRFSALSEENQKALLRSFVDNHSVLSALLRRLPPVQRAAYFEYAIATTQTQNTVWNETLMRCLPHRIRHREARRILGLPKFKDRTYPYVRYLGFLDYDNTEEHILKRTQSHKAEDRANAWPALIGLCASNRRGIDRLIGQFNRLHNEQDPIRQSAIEALKHLPIRLIQPHHLPQLSQLVDAIIDARDTSYGTRQGIQRLAHRFICAYGQTPNTPFFQFALQCLEKLAGQAGVMDFPRLDLLLPRGTERVIVDALLPFLEHQQQRQYILQIIHIVSRLGKRAWGLAPIDGLLEKSIWTASKGDSMACMTLWLSDPSTRDDRIQSLLAKDKSAFNNPIIQSHLHRHRQDLLTPYLNASPISGRWHQHAVGIIPFFTSGIERWSVAQQLTYIEVLKKIIQDKGQKLWTRTSCIRTLTEVPSTTMVDLLPYFRTQSIPIAEAAMGSSIWLDSPQAALPFLFEYLDGNRARVAMYAIPRIARFIIPAALGAQLRALLKTEGLKITVQKEVFRLMGHHHVPAAADVFIEHWNKANCHRDVKMAILNASTCILDRPQIWTLLDAAARDTAEVASALLYLPLHQIEPHHQDRFVSLLIQLESHPDPQTRAMLIDRLGRIYQLWTGHHIIQIIQCVCRTILASDYGTGWKKATYLLALLGKMPEGQKHLLQLFQQLLHLRKTEVTFPSPTNDQPIRQRIRVLIEHVLSLSYLKPTAYQRLCLELTRVLQNHPQYNFEFAMAHFNLTLRHCDWTSLNLHPDDLVSVIPSAPHPLLWSDMAHDFAIELRRSMYNETALKRLGVLLGQSNDFHRYMAISLVEVAGEVHAWTADWCEHLNRLRNDKNPYISAKAMALPPQLPH